MFDVEDQGLSTFAPSDSIKAKLLRLIIVAVLDRKSCKRSQWQQFSDVDTRFLQEQKKTG